MVKGIQEVLKHEPAPFESPMDIQEPQLSHVENAIQHMKNKLADQIQQMQTMMQEMQLQYDALN